MPRLRNVRQQEAVRAFVRAGGTERAGRGSHRVVNMSNGRMLSVPAGILKIGLLRRLIQRADLTDEQFEKLL